MSSEGVTLRKLSVRHDRLAVKRRDEFRSIQFAIWEQDRLNRGVQKPDKTRNPKTRIHEAKRAIEALDVELDDIGSTMEGLVRQMRRLAKETPKNV